jgi:sugar phosphate isomerase/epimerase
LGATVREAGLEVVIDPVMTWYGPPMPGIALADVGMDEVLSMAEALEAVSLGAIAHPAVDRPIAELAEPFAVLCDRAADVGARVHLEFMPMLAIGDLSAAWAIVSGAGRENGGLLFDTWHFFRGNPDFELLENIPGDRIFGVQVADAAADDSGDLGRDTFNRLIPGEGSLDLVRVLGSLDRIGGLGCVGPEVISPVTASMDPADAARLTRDRIGELIGQVRSATER